MNMVGVQDRSASRDADITGGGDSIMPSTLIFTPTAEEMKYWAKRHRTFVASSASGMVASGVTVSFVLGRQWVIAHSPTVPFGFLKDTHAIVCENKGPPL